MIRNLIRLSNRADGLLDLEERVTALERALGDGPGTGAEIDTLRDEIDTLRGSVETVESEVGDLDDRLTEVDEQRGEQIGEAFTALSGRLDDVQHDVDELAQRIDERPPGEGPADTGALVVGQQGNYASVQDALDAIERWGSRTIKLGNSYDPSVEDYPIVMGARKQRVTIEGGNAILGDGHADGARAVLEIDAGLYRSPGPTFKSLHIMASGAQHGVRAVSARYVNAVDCHITDAEGFGWLSERNSDGNAHNNQQLHYCDISDCGGGVHFKEGVHNGVLRGCHINANRGPGARFDSAAGSGIMGGTIQNNAGRNIEASGYWDFTINGPLYTERVTSTTPGDDIHVDADISIENHHTVTIDGVYGLGSNNADHLIQLPGVGAADISGVLGWRFDASLLGDMPDDTDLTAVRTRDGGAIHS